MKAGQALLMQCIQWNDLFRLTITRKTMKKVKWIILFVVCVTAFLNCKSNTVQYKMMQERDQIVSIQIAEGISEKDAGEENYDKIKVITTIPQEKWDVFLVDFSNVQCLKFRNDPCQSLEGTIIYITYKNGAIELIGNWAAFYHWIDGANRGDFRPYYFDVEQFEFLIAKYAER